MKRIFVKSASPLVLGAILVSCKPWNPSNTGAYTCKSAGYEPATKDKSELLFPISSAELWGFINRDGSIFVEPRFKDVGRFSEGLAAFKSIYDGLWGYIDPSGEIVIEPIFVAASPFYEGRAVVTINGKQGAIDKDGEFVIEPLYQRVLSFHEDRTFVLRGSFWSLVDIEGKLVTENTFSQVNSFHEGLASFTGFNGDFSVSGYLNRDGDIQIHMRDKFFINIEGLGFSFGRDGISQRRPATLTQYLFPGKWGDKVYGLIDRNGEVVVPIRYDFIGVDSDCIARVAINDRYGAIDLKGNVLIPLEYSDIGDFSEGLAIAQKTPNGKYGYIDERGKFVISPSQYIDHPLASALNRDFHNNRAAFKSDAGQFGYIDTVGDFVIEPIFESASPFKDGLAKFEDSKGWGYLNTSGIVVWHSTMTDSYK